MAGKRSIYTDVVLKVTERIGRMREEAQASHPIPFMEERVTAAEFRRRFRQMGAEDRRAVIQKMGVDDVMKKLGGRAANE